MYLLFLFVIGDNSLIKLIVICMIDNIYGCYVEVLVRKIWVVVFWIFKWFVNIELWVNFIINGWVFFGMISWENIIFKGYFFGIKFLM